MPYKVASNFDKYVTVESNFHPDIRALTLAGAPMICAKRTKPCRGGELALNLNKSTKM